MVEQRRPSSVPPFVESTCTCKWVCKTSLNHDVQFSKKQTVRCLLIFLLQMQTRVNVKKLVPPSFYDVAVMTEGVPSVQEETVV